MEIDPFPLLRSIDANAGPRALRLVSVSDQEERDSGRLETDLELSVR